MRHFFTLHLCFALFLSGTAFPLAGQGLTLEWQSPPGTQPPGFLLDINGFQDGQLDYDGNGLNEVVMLQKPPGGEPYLVIIRDNGDMLLDSIFSLAGYPITDYKFRGFDNVAGSATKELIFSPKPGTGAPIVVARLQGNMGLGITTIGENVTFNDTLLFLLNVQNMDADVTCELISYEFPTGVLQVWGEGFTPNLDVPDPTEGVEKSLTCEDFAIQWVSPPNLSWPSLNLGFLPAGARDFNGDGSNDIFYLLDSLLVIINPLNQETLWSAVLPQDIWAGDEFGPYVLGCFDFCGSGDKQVLLGTSNELLSFPILLQETSRWVVLAPDMLLDSFQIFRIWDLFAGLPGGAAPLTLRAVGDPNQDDRMELIFQHEINRRIVVVGNDEDGFQENPPDGLNPDGPETTNSGPYGLELRYESPPGSRPFFDLGNLFSRKTLDLNGDEEPELIVWREEETDTTAVGCRVYDLQNQELLWNFDFPTGTTGDTLRRLHGFYDANGDGQKELFLGARTVVTQDGQLHQPFGDFRTFAILDMDGDGFEEVIGLTPDGRVQIWGKTETNAVDSPSSTQNAKFTVFPNPADQEITLSLTLPRSGNYTVRLLDLQGREHWLRSWQLPAGRQNLALEETGSLPAGLYLVELTGPQTRKVQPVVIVR